MQYTLQQHLRFLIHRKIRPLFIKDNCEVCGTRDDLEMHHTKPFSKMLDEVLDFLELPHKKYGEYSKRELTLIEHVMLSKHLSVMVITLCQECHLVEHRSGVNHMFYYNQKREKEREKYTKEKLVPFLEKNLSVLFFGDEREAIIDMCDIRVDGKQRRSLKRINEGLEENSIPFRIKRGRSYRRFLECGEGNKNINKRYWTITRE